MRQGYEPSRAHGLQAGVLLALILLWELGTRFFQVSPLILPPPSSVIVQTIAETPLILNNVGSTLIAIFVGFFAASIGGAVLGALMISSSVIEKTVFPLLILSQTIPKIAIAPLLLIWFGYGLKSKIVVSLLMAFFPVLIDTMVGLRSTPQELILLARSMGAGPFTQFRRFRLPYAMPFVFGGLRVAAVFAVTGTVVAEFVGGENGLVYLLSIAQAQYETPVVFGIIIILSVITMIMLALVEAVEQWTIPWYIATRGDEESFSAAGQFRRAP